MSVLMAERLKANRQKGIWNYTRMCFINLLMQEVSELVHELTQETPDRDRVTHEAADVAVIAAMIVDMEGKFPEVIRNMCEDHQDGNT